MIADYIMVEIIPAEYGWISEKCSFNDLRHCRENKCFKQGNKWFYNNKGNELVEIEKEEISFDSILLEKFKKIFEIDLELSDFNLDLNSLAIKIDSMISCDVRNRLHENYHKIIYG